MDQDAIQKIALNNWIQAGRKGTIEAVTGIGKTFISLHAICTFPKGSSVVFLAEVGQREVDVLQDMHKYKMKFGVDILNDYEFTFACYQSAYKWTNRHYNLIIADEIHDSLTPQYFKFYENNFCCNIIGLSATIDRDTKYNNKITKGEMLDAISPVCFTYGLDASIKNKTSRKLNVYVINHELESIKRECLAGTKLKPFYTTEEKNYKYWEKAFLKAASLELPECNNLEDYRIAEKNKEMMILRSSNARAKILYNLPSKIKATKRLISILKGKTIVFSNSIDSLLLVTKHVVSSKNNKETNTRIRELFDNDEITEVGSFKMLKQGANLKGAKNVITMSYYSKEKDIIQRVGRLRKDGSIIGSVFIFRTRDTQEEIWFERMMSNISELNIIECDSVEDCIYKYQRNERNN